MRFWISFSPIGQSPSTSEKNKDLSEDKKIDFQSDANHEGLELFYLFQFFKFSSPQITNCVMMPEK